MTRRRTARERLRACSEEGVREAASFLREEVRRLGEDMPDTPALRAVVARLDEELRRRKWR